MVEYFSKIISKFLAAFMKGYSCETHLLKMVEDCKEALDNIMMMSSNGKIFRVTGHLCGALIFSLICVQINGWVNNREAAELRRRHAHYDVIVV